MSEQRYDVVVVGGGAAGLSGALTLGRARRSVLVIDSGEPRNAPAEGVHTYLGREGTPPGELLAIGREEVRGYGGQFLEGTAVAAERRTDGGFRVDLAGGSTVVARRLLVTTGLVDELPELPGMAELWGKDVLHCPYCHGWEVRDQAIGVLATGPLAVHQALLWRQWSADITLFLHTAPKPTEEEYGQLAARGITVIDGEVAALESADGRLSGLRLTDGTVTACRALAVAPRFTARAGLLTSLGLEPVDLERNGHVIGSSFAADPMGATAVPGVWVAGNATSLMDQVIAAAAAGVRAAAAINADLVEEETGLAVTAWFWDNRYRSGDRIWSGKPNPVLVRETPELTMGRALDLGCGEGADAIWLAEQGWEVTATDISQIAIDRAAEHAAERGVGERIDWQLRDLATSFPEGPFDLVSAQFLHSFLELPRERILRTAAATVAPGGVLLIVGHGSHPSMNHPHVQFPTPDEVLATLELPPSQWEVLLNEEFEQEYTDHDGQPMIRTNNTLKLRRNLAG